MLKPVKYFVSDHALSGFLLHRAGCLHLPAANARTFIGSCYSKEQALSVSQTNYRGVKLCLDCLIPMETASFLPPAVKSGSKKKQKTSPKEKAEMIYLPAERKSRKRIMKVKAVRHLPKMS
ncbi:hypothetical protein [Pantoea sp. M_9]|uniref:hypothetical protein n=1 Tax=Pantoea sp. M_9 TaxID=2608041 RepID=UPI00123216FC|nr:hypothetical protein [Pantoea sp. M_9]KAA5972587.1 hypothetical protein F3I15_00845 [Pantoea sp. M_9]